MGDRVEQDVRSYYRKVSRFIDRERAEEADAGFWRALAREHRTGHGLDLGCGTGRVTVQLAAELAWTLGVDLSLAMLERARRSLGELPPGRLALLAADVRRLRLGRRFELIVAANDPLAHLAAGEDRDRVLAVVAAHLSANPRGRFVLDAHWFPPSRLRRAMDEQGLVVEHEGEGLDVRETWRCEPDGACHARYEYLRGGELIDQAEFDSRYWSIDEVHDRFARAGLAITALWGDYDRTPWRSDASSHLVVEARRG